MKFRKTPVKGTCDILPEEMKLREYVLSMIKETYKLYGFSQIETPVMEHIENLTGKQGGENEKLMFQILKRGEELKKAFEDRKEELADSGLRYDLTVPLARYYANNISKLTMPFKSLQIGNVFRADKPQKGRFRQFMQCDIDILGDNTILAEIELIAATSTMLTNIFKEVGISEFTVHINDRRLLKAMGAYSGFCEENFDEVFISLDKIDKLGTDKVKEELLFKGYPMEKVTKFISIFSNWNKGISCAEYCSFITKDFVETQVIENIDTIIACVKKMINKDVKLVYNPALVRGMSYYTGTIFEISITGYNFSIAGGGRYDEMIGKFCGQNMAACGFSIGFERIITILQDNAKGNNYKNKKNIAFLIDKSISSERVIEIFEEATALRECGNIVLVQPLNKNAKFQVENLEKDGYKEIRKVLS
ncbi:histidine--tRNA ligase [Anaerocolumna cellulosilytica]|uniref:Histidine--tRNA ligase n=1 Tax=Anaerocolumna cellulosilytica TaxID=433286 RepID=A0A6S6R2X6_9FIRM|nr:histidine--tRNA ligase [Anaerocolumna cellulosilytica]MBB5196027.1 histidyl-tRNA synthetase [Anaerocolumna cellulosilytica]BCJ93670.1 histidine--tRNA ligase [Anaerocolumna cellulosilytica]